MNWIKVTDRMPDKAGRYMICDKYGNIHVRDYNECQRYPFDIRPNHPHYFMAEWWAELPEAPKEAKYDN
jgi:hypothetical protein